MSAVVSLNGGMGVFNNIQWHWNLLPPAVLFVLAAFFCYLGGRAQQWRRQVDEREEAFIKGYNTATLNLFSLATRVSKASATQAPMLMDQRPKRKPRSFTPGRHAVDTGKMSTLEKTESFGTSEKTKPLV